LFHAESVHASSGHDGRPEARDHGPIPRGAPNWHNAMTCNEPPAPVLRRMPLTELPAGTSGRVCALAGEPSFCVRLREMGFCESAVVDKVAGSRMLICVLCETRIALSDAAASHILVEPV